MNNVRNLDYVQTFGNIVSWIEGMVQKERAPGAVIGISGTDSILTFRAVYQAYENLNKANRVLGLHFGARDQFNWVANEIFPWLKSVAPQANLEIIDLGADNANDSVRWGHLMARAVRDTADNHSLSSSHYFPIGTRNATEDYLGTYSQISKSVSALPIIDLYKSEVLELCTELNVPEIALYQSCQIDCDCGRFDTAAEHLKEVDWYIMKNQGQLSADFYKANVSAEVRAKVMEYAIEEKARNEFRLATPYRPSQSLIARP